MSSNHFIQEIVKFNTLAAPEAKPEQFDPRRTALYYGLILEEVAEAIEALKDRPGFAEIAVMLHTWSKLFKEGEFDSDVENCNRLKTLDAFVDIAVVALGGAHALGSDVEGACTEVMRANMSKFSTQPDGSIGFARDAVTGKVMKSKTYKPPKLDKFLFDS